MFQKKTINVGLRIDSRGRIGYHIKYKEHIKIINRFVHK